MEDLAEEQGEITDFTLLARPINMTVAFIGSDASVETVKQTAKAVRFHLPLTTLLAPAAFLPDFTTKN